MCNFPYYSRFSLFSGFQIVETANKNATNEDAAKKLLFAVTRSPKNAAKRCTKNSAYNVGESNPCFLSNHVHQKQMIFLTLLFYNSFKQIFQIKLHLKYNFKHFLFTRRKSNLIF